MRVRICRSAHLSYDHPINDIFMLSDEEAEVCYTPKAFDIILDNVPKIIAMLLYNEREYDVSGSPGPYAAKETNGLEYIIFRKWIEIFKQLISAKYPEIDQKTVYKLALENAHYFISVFAPCTVMVHAVSLQQIYQIVGICHDMADYQIPDAFIAKLRPWLVEIAIQLEARCGVATLSKDMLHGFSLFTDNERNEFFNECYSVNYSGSFAQLAEAQKHRNLWYEMKTPKLDNCSFYVPPIIEDDRLMADYLHDMNLLKMNFPQGMLVEINERGTLECFLQKCNERLCGAEPLEICLQTRRTLDRYTSGCVTNDSPQLYAKLFAYACADRTKCQFGYYECDRLCPLGPEHAFDRLV